MKKIAVAALALTAAGAALAEVVSANVVGYQNIEVKPGFNMIAFNFQPVTGSGAEAFYITNFVGNTSALIAGSGATSSDQIQVWDPATAAFSVYFYRAKSNRFPAGPAWVKTTAGSTVTADTIPTGAGVWFARPDTAPATANLTVSGEVGASAHTHTIASGFNMISSAFPVDMALNGGAIDWAACGAVAGSGATSSDQIQVWDATTQTFTVYFYRAKSNRFPAGPAWVNTTAGSTATTDTIPAGKGFWYARPSTSAAGTLTETSPIAQ
jgi:hypothetical protein